MCLQVRQHRAEQGLFESPLKAMCQAGNQHQRTSTHMCRDMHAMHHRQQRIGRAMHHQGGHAQATQQLHATGLGENGQQLTLYAFRVEGPVVGARRLGQQVRPRIGQ